METNVFEAWSSLAHLPQLGFYDSFDMVGSLVRCPSRQGFQIVGFLCFVIQIIGVDEDHEPVTLNGVVLTEAKVLAFGVAQAYRRQGIGRALQEAVLHHAKQLGCYQVRSHSSGDHEANHQLKLAMGFGVHPLVRGNDTRGVYFVMRLKRDHSET